MYQGYSAELTLNLRRDRGRQLWSDPATEERIATFASERERADRESAVRAAAETPVRELAARLHQQGS